MTEESNLRDLIRETASEEEGRLRLSCAQAFALAEKAGVSVSDFGKACDQEKIKIAHCQLGCFA